MVAGFGYGDYGAFLAVVAVVVQSIRVVGHPYKTAEVGGQAGSDGRASRANGLLGDDATIRRAQAVEVKDVLAVAGAGAKQPQVAVSPNNHVVGVEGDGSSVAGGQEGPAPTVRTANVGGHVRVLVGIHTVDDAVLIYCLYTHRVGRTADVAGGRAVGIKHQQAILAVTVVVARTDGDVAIGRGKHQALVVEAGERLGPAGVGVDEEGGDGDYGEDYYGQDGNVAAGGGFEEFTERRPQPL